MKSKTKSEPTLRERAAALAVMASEVLLMVLEDPVAAAVSRTKIAKPTAATTPKPFIKRKGRPPMTEAQRAAAKAERDAENSNRAAALGAARAADRPKPQPVTRESLAARNVVDRDGTAAEHPIVVGAPSYFTKAG